MTANPISEPHQGVETATDKLRTLRHLCDANHQPFYVEIIDEVLAGFDPPDCKGILEVRPCLDANGNIRCYDLCPPHEENAKAGPVVAEVYSGKEVAEQIAAAWNTRAIPELSTLKDRVRRLEEVISAWAFTHNIDGAARNDLFVRIRTALGEPQC